MKQPAFFLMLLSVLTSCRSSKQVTINNQEQIIKTMLFKWKDGLKAYEKEEAKVIFYMLVDKIDGFDSFKEYQIVSDRFEAVYVLEFSNKNAFEVYNNHPLHKELSQKGPELISDYMEYIHYK